MAVETSPSLTSTSHTLTAAPIMAPSDSPLAGSTHVLALLERLREGNRHAFLQPTAAIPTDSLGLVKDALEGFAGQVGDEQQERLKENRKRKRGGNEDVLKVRKVYVDGFETEQVWQQAKRIIGGVLKYSEEALEELKEKEEIVANGVGPHDDADGSRLLEFGEDGFELGSDDDEEEEGSDEEEDEDEDEDDDVEGLIDGEALEDGDEDDWEDEEEGEAEADDQEDDQEDDSAEEYVDDPHGLNDGFFSIDDFNRQTQWFEDQDAKGDPNTDQVSDEEDIDWAADPLAPPKDGKKKAARDEAPSEDEDEDDDDEEGGGPTFGDMALDAPEGASDDEAEDVDMDDEANDFNANEVYYKDFFAPPPRKSKGGKPRKPREFKPKQPEEEDVQRAMDDVRRDLFDDESDVEDSEDALSDVSAGDPKSRRSAHERRQAKLAEEIRKLEAASIAKREWAMSGEAAAVDRPTNSLLAEDLDFEHIGKPVPVITPEVTEGIEELIKRRILAQEFDEVIKRRPDADVPQNTRRGLAEVDDTKNTKGLAEVYEEEYNKQANPDTYVSASDEKLQREEKEVEAMWRDLSASLDALSSWHYKPKPAAPSLSVVADVATVTMEDAQPATAQGVAGESSRLAPQEVYKPGAREADGSGGAAAGEVVTKAGLPLARQEMSREDKARRRRREKERVRKAGGVDGAKGVVSRRAQSQRDTMAELRKGGVKVINRKGEVTDIDGRKAKAAKVATGKNFKL